MTDRFDTRPNIQTKLTGGTTLPHEESIQYRNLCKDIHMALGLADRAITERDEALAEIDRLKKELDEAKIALGQQPCEICGDTECPDANTDYYIRRWKETQELLRNLVDYVEDVALLQCDCGQCALCEAKKELSE